MTIVSELEKIDEWAKEKKLLIQNYKENTLSYKRMKINRGDIFLCKIGENIGDETCKERPVIVLSKTFFNNATTQITIAPLSTTIKTKINNKGKEVPSVRTHYILKKKDYSFLSGDSCIKCEQIRSVSKARLVHKIGNITDETLKKIDARIKDLFDI